MAGPGPLRRPDRRRAPPAGRRRARRGAPRGRLLRSPSRRTGRRRLRRLRAGPGAPPGLGRGSPNCPTTGTVSRLRRAQARRAGLPSRGLPRPRRARPAPRRWRGGCCGCSPRTAPASPRRTARGRDRTRRPRLARLGPGPQGPRGRLTACARTAGPARARICVLRGEASLRYHRRPSPPLRCCSAASRSLSRFPPPRPSPRRPIRSRIRRRRPSWPRSSTRRARRPSAQPGPHRRRVPLAPGLAGHRRGVAPEVGLAGLRINPATNAPSRDVRLHRPRLPRLDAAGDPVPSQACPPSAASATRRGPRRPPMAFTLTSPTASSSGSRTSPRAPRPALDGCRRQRRLAGRRLEWLPDGGGAV